MCGNGMVLAEKRSPTVSSLYEKDLLSEMRFTVPGFGSQNKQINLLSNTTGTILD